MADVLEGREVAGVRQHDAAVRHHRLDDHPGDPALVLGERALRRLGVVERDDDDLLRDALGHPQRLRHRDRVIARPGLLLRREHAHHQRVVVPVVGAFDLHDEVPAGEGAHDPHRVEGRLGPRVPEAPVREAVARLQLFGDDQRVLGRLREVRPELDATLDRLDDLRMRVAHHHHAVAVVVVDVLVAVDVPYVRALASRHVDRVRRPGLPRGGHAARQMRLRLLAVRDAPDVLVVERGDLALRQLLDEPEVDVDDAGARAHGSACSSRSSRICGNDETASDR